MKQNKERRKKGIGMILFLLSVGLFCLQLAALFVQEKYNLEYSDDRLFYVINIFCIVFLFLALLFLLNFHKKMKWISSIIVGITLIIHIILLIDSTMKTNNIISVAPNLKNIFVVKEDTLNGEAVYYRTYFGIFAREKETLPFPLGEEHKVKWLANDVAALTYETTGHGIQQYIGTYGDRKEGLSYYYVVPEMYGEWGGADGVVVNSDTNGISITENHKTEMFEWDNIHQFGTLAVVLKKNNVAFWTISLNEDFVVQSDSSIPKQGTITLYKATMDKNMPITLQYLSSQNE